MIKVIIVDDEPRLGNEIKRMLESYHSDVEVVAVCHNTKEAEDAINKYSPNLVFLDVELGKNQTGFDLLKKITAINFEIIFTTGFNRYAQQAIKFSAIDYLLKPIDEHELKVAIDKFRAKNFKPDADKVEVFLSAWANPGNQQNKIPLPTMKGYDLVTIADIVYCEGLSNQTSFVLNNNKTVVISMTLKECEDLLLPYKFFRIHKSYLINLNYVKRFIKGSEANGTAVMLNGASLNVSRGFRKQFIEKLSIP